MGDHSAYLDQLRCVLSFLNDHFPDAAELVLNELKEQEAENARDGEAGHSPSVKDEAVSQERTEDHDSEHRAKSAEVPATRSDDGARNEEEGPIPMQRWQSAEAVLTRRLSGSTRLYEDPDIDEYDGMDDCGYWRREVVRQDEFVAHHLERVTDDDSGDILCGLGLNMGTGSSGALTPASTGTPVAGSPSGGSRSPSSSASLSSPGGMHSGAAAIATGSGSGGGAGAAAGAHASADRSVGEEAAWDEGPAGITFAEPVTTPTKDPSRRSSASEPKPALSRVESLSNSFIDDLESDLEGSAPFEGREDDAAAARATGGGASGGGSEERAAGGFLGGDIEFSLPSQSPGQLAKQEQQQQQPDDAAEAPSWGAAAGATGSGTGGSPSRNSSSSDLPGIFDIALRMAASSRASSMDVMYGSVLGTSDVGSERGFSLGAALGAGGSGADLQSPPPATHRPSPLGPGAVAAGGGAGGGEAGVKEEEEEEEAQDSLEGGLQGESSASAFGSAAAQAGGGFSFPVTPPARGDDEVHEVHAERVFSTWASSHSRTAGEGDAADGGGGGDAEGASDGEDGTPGKSGGGGLVLPFCMGALDGPPLRQTSSSSSVVQQQQLNTWWEGPASSSAAAEAAEAKRGWAVAIAPPVVAEAPSPHSPGQSRRATGSSGDSAAVMVAVTTHQQQQQQRKQQPQERKQQQQPQGRESDLFHNEQQLEQQEESGQQQHEKQGVDHQRTEQQQEEKQQQQQQQQQQQEKQAKRRSTPPAGGSSASGRSNHAAVIRPLFVSDDDEVFCTPAASAGGSSSGGRRSPRCASAGTGGRGGGAGGAASGGEGAGGSGGVGEEEDGGVLLEEDAEAGLVEGALASPGPPSVSDHAADAASEAPAPRYIIDESGNLLYEYDPTYIEAKYEVFDLRVVHRRRRTGFEDSKEFPIRRNDLIAGRYQVMDFLGSAAFSQAVQALDVATGGLVCLKIIKNNKDYFDQSLDEIKLLRYVNSHDPNDEHHIVRLYDFFYYKEHLFLVCELLRANLYEFQKYQRDNGDEPYFTLPRIQRIATQVLQSLAFLHSLGLVHSDLKPENILIKSYSRCEVKVIDLGSSCFVTDHLSSYVQSRSYRAPEVILGLRYDHKVDIWSLGCILAELATGYVLFQNDSLATLLARLEGILGPVPSFMISQGRYSHRFYTRSRQLYEANKRSRRYELLLPKRTSLRHRVPQGDEQFLDFLAYLLTPDPGQRPGAEEALQHPWLRHPYPPAEPMQE